MTEGCLVTYLGSRLFTEYSGTCGSGDGKRGRNMGGRCEKGQGDNKRDVNLVGSRKIGVPERTRNGVH